MTETPTLGLQLGVKLPLKWGNRLNERLLLLDSAIGKVCTPEQIAAIRAIMGPDDECTI